MDVGAGRIAAAERCMTNRPGAPSWDAPDTSGDTSARRHGAGGVDGAGPDAPTNTLPPTPLRRILAFVDRISGGRADWVVRFVTYAIVGGSAAVVNLICFSLLYYRSPIYFGSSAVAQSLRYIVVFAIAAEISTLTNFIINDRVTFSKLPGHARSWFVRCLRFHLTTIVGTLLTFVISFTLARLGVPALLAQMTAIGIAFLVNFTLHHVFTYRRLGGQTPLFINWQGGGIEGMTASGSHFDVRHGEGRPNGSSPSSPPPAPTPTTPATRTTSDQEMAQPGLPLKFSIVIPAHNEEEALRPTISRLYRVLADERIPFEIVVVNDHSTDGTEAALRQLSHEYPAMRYVSNQKPGGFGRAIQTGLEHFAGDAVCIVMADASDDPRDVVTYYRKLQQGYECVFGSRFVAGSKVIDYPRHKLLVNRLANWFINVLFQLHFNDTTNAFKAYRREVIAGVSPVLAPHFNITVELPLKAITRGYTYATVPINWYNRATGVSKLKIQEMGSRYLFIVLYIWLEKQLARGDYRRPQQPQPSDADRDRDPALIWAQYETMPHKSVLRGTPIDEIDTQKTPAINGNAGHAATARTLNGSRGSTAAVREPTGATGGAGAVAFPASPAAVAGDAASSARIPAWFAWLTSLAVVALGLAIYGRSLHILPLSDDWGFLESSFRGPQAVFLFTANYHYNPVAQGVMYVVYLLFGLNPVPYHLVTLALFSVSVVLTLRLGWKLTGSFTVGALASLLFVLSGRQYEGVVWTLVSIFQALGLALYLGGLLFYLHAQGQQGRRRRWMLIGFYACMILAIFTYEQEITLVVACMLYRLFVIEHGAGWNGRALLARARVWLIEFGFPVIFFAAYLGFKYWLSLQTGRSQAPGLSLHIPTAITLITIGLYESFMPGILAGKLWTLQLGLLQSLGWGHPLGTRIVSFIKVLAPLGIVIVFARPVYRWLALWSVLVVASTVFGIGYLASRYQLLFVVPAVILWAAFLVLLARLLRRLAFILLDNILMVSRESFGGLRRAIPALVWLPLIALIVVYGVVGVRYTSAQIANWQQASDIEGAAIARIATLGAERPTVRTLYLVNVPDNLPAPADPSGHFEHGAYLFQDGAASMVGLSLPGRFQTIQYLRTPDYHAIGTPHVLSRAEVDALSTNPADMVVCFSNQTNQIEPWGPLCT